MIISPEAISVKRGIHRLDLYYDGRKCYMVDRDVAGSSPAPAEGGANGRRTRQRTTEYQHPNAIVPLKNDAMGLLKLARLLREIVKLITPSDSLPRMRLPSGCLPVLGEVVALVDKVNSCWGIHSCHSEPCRKQGCS